MTTPPSEHTSPRAPEQPAGPASTGADHQASAPVGHLPPPPGPPPPTPGGGPRSRGTVLAGIVGALVLVAGLVVGGVLVFRDDGDEASGDRTGKQRTAAPAPSRSSAGDDGPQQDSPSPSTVGRVDDRVNGVSLPLPDGWQRLAMDGGVSVFTGPYPCPADPALECVRAQIASDAAPDRAADEPRRMAEEDVARNAREGYDDAAYGGVTSHREVLSEPATVAGQRGYRVRWRVATGQGTEAYVESLVFPSPLGNGTFVRVRAAWDVHEEAPTEAEIDRLLGDIRPLADRRDPNEV